MYITSDSFPDVFVLATIRSHNSRATGAADLHLRVESSRQHGHVCCAPEEATSASGHGPMAPWRHGGSRDVPSL